MREISGLSDQSLVARRVGNLEFITAAAPAYLERKGTPTHPLEIKEKHASVIYFSPQNGRHYPLQFRRGMSPSTSPAPTS